MDVLISGGSIAGLSTAYWMSRYGHRVTVVERADGLRSGGVAIDVRQQALSVAQEMGILDEIRKNRVKADDIYRFVNSESQVEAVFEPATQFYDSADDIEISRDALGEILARHMPSDVEFLFGVGIDTLEDRDPGVLVTLSDGTARNFDLVVGADGMHSTVRSLVFGAEKEFLRHLGLYVAIVKHCEVDEPVVGSIVYNIPGRMAMMRGDGTSCSLLLGFRSPWIEYDYRDTEVHRSLVSAAFENMHGWRMHEVHREVGRASELYFDSVGQILMPRWTSGHVALVGDAGYCASFFSGMGTSLAMIGAATLAKSIESAGGHLRLGLEAYDQAMAPVVAEAQKMAEDGAAILFPRTANEIKERNANIRNLLQS